VGRGSEKEGKGSNIERSTEGGGKVGVKGKPEGKKEGNSKEKRSSR